MQRTEATLRGIFWAGLVGGVASAVPPFSLGNCFCCLWAWLTGVLAVLLIRRREPLEERDVPRVGALAGAYAGLVALTLRLIGMVLFGGSQQAQLSDIQEMFPDTFSPESLDFLASLTGGGQAQIGMIVVAGIFEIGLFTLFGTLGALLYARMTRPPAPHPAPAEHPPAPPPGRQPEPGQDGPQGGTAPTG
jgi:hypothetical protein